VSWSPSRVFTASAGSETSAEPSVESLVAQHYAFIWRLLRGLGLSRTDAEDAAQQVFMIAARKLHRISPDRARSFLYGTALRVASTARRGIQRRRETASESDEGVDAECRGPERMAEIRKAQALLHELLSKLPDRLRRVLVLAEVEQLEIQEIAALERIPLGTAGSRLRLARGRLRELLAAARHRNPFAGEP
jgi:RNA polymerase sigma-70 factor (ECF subfamily)